MIHIKSKLKVRRAAYKIEVKGRLELSAEARRKGRLKARLDSGEEVDIALPPGETIRGGDLLTASDGRVIEVLASAEQVLHVECANAADLTRIAYHLGSRHIAVEVGQGYLRIAHDHSLEEMLLAMGASLQHMAEPFEPELDTSHSPGQANSPHDHHQGHHHHGDDDDHGHGHKH